MDLSYVIVVVVLSCTTWMDGLMGVIDVYINYNGVCLYYLIIRGVRGLRRGWRRISGYALQRVRLLLFAGLEV